VRTPLADTMTAPADQRAAFDGRWPAPADGRTAPACRWAALTGLVLLPVLCLFGPPVAISSVASEVSLETSVDRDSVLIADPIVYTVEILARPDLLVEPPSFTQQLGPFEVRDIEFQPPEDTSGEHAGQPEGVSPGAKAAMLRRTLIRWTLVPYQTGRLEIPALPVVVADTAGAADTLHTGVVPIEVISLEPDLQGDIRDIKPPEELPREWAWLGWSIGGLVLLAVGLWVLRRLRRRRLQEDLEKIPYQGPPRPAHQIALEELDRIAALHLLDKGLVKEHYIQVSDAIRRYAQGRYAIGAMELTTWELISEMRRTAVREDERESFRSFLEECDLVKFARHIPPAGIRETLLDRARRLVVATRIPDRPETAEKSPAVATDAQPAGVPES